MLTIKPLKLHDFTALLELKVPASRLSFVLPFEQAYATRTKNDIFYTLRDNRTVVGFFIIDSAFAHSVTYALRNELGLRNLFIGAEFQDKNYEQQAIDRLRLYAFAINPNCSSICTTLRANDHLGTQLIRSCGFNDTGDKFYGDNGKELIFRCLL
ncbi:hypothetical protein HGP28_06950 [Vibrio sp. SM6]|uniref:N-acetyltransferase n=1 Tax=Vibrio agarilyticus TaxID=2726741 RepID=A0A7X8YGP7_9VIBR|nr:hypothetical protein [Vibrio agarilyticus]NLS12641.1 hypothetical protein [Vibrio agarilyticus]